MPIHDWTRVESGVFHAFHHSWIEEISRTLNRGLLPKGYYALPEQIAGGSIPDVLTLQATTNGHPNLQGTGLGGIATAVSQPKVAYHTQTDEDQYATKAKGIAVRHVSNHEIVAMIEIVSPGNKSSKNALRMFVEKAAEMLRAGVHLLVIDLFPPTSRDPNGIHKAIWDEFVEKDYDPPADKPLTIAAYIGGLTKEALVEPVALGTSLPDMPLFLTVKFHVMVPLEKTYQSAWEALPEYWRDVLSAMTAK
jgi:Protein of unknown function (DUF4058)